MPDLFSSDDAARELLRRGYNSVEKRGARYLQRPGYGTWIRSDEWVWELERVKAEEGGRSSVGPDPNV